MKKECSQVLEMLKKDEKIKNLLSSDKVIVIRQVWKKDSYAPDGLEVIYSKSENPRYAVGEKYKFTTGIYHSFLLDALREGHEVIVVNETDGIIDFVMYLQKL